MVILKFFFLILAAYFKVVQIYGQLKYFSFLTLLFFWACTNHTLKKPNNETLFSDVTPTPTEVDSIEIGKDLPFKPTDTASFVNNPGVDAIIGKRPVLQSNKYPFTAPKLLAPTATDTVFTIVPKIIEDQPLIAYVRQPSPIKVGEFRATKTATENIQYLDVEQGLPGSNVNAIEEDQFGNMWFALSNGLCKYDGNYLYHYTKESGLPHNFIDALFFDSKNNFWISSNGGLVRYDGLKFHIYTSENGLTKDNIGRLVEDDNGHLWFPCDKGLVKYDHEKFSVYDQELGLRKNEILTVGVDSLNRIFIGYFAAPADFLNGDTVERFFSSWPIFGSDMPLNTYRGKDKNLWLSNYSGGAVKLSPFGQAQQYFPKTGIGYRLISSTLIDQNGTLWFASSEAGAARLDNLTYTGFTTTEGLSSNLVTDMLEDSRGNIWMSTMSGGVNRLIPGSFRSYTAADGLSEKTITSISQNDKGEILFSTWADGVWIFNGQEFSHIENEIGGIIAYGFTKDYFGNTIVGVHQFGTFSLTPSDIDTVSYSKIVNFNNNSNFRPWGIRRMEVEPSGNLWLCDDLNGLYRLVLNKDKTAYAYCEHYTKESGLNSNTILTMAQSANGTIYISSKGMGLSKIHNGTITHYTEKNGLPSNLIYTLYVDKKDRLWLGTTNGAAIFENEKFTTISTKDNLTSDLVTSIIEENDGKLWLATNGGLNYLEPNNQSTCGYAITPYGTEDGLKSIDFLPGAVFHDDKNNIWWATRGDVVKLDLNHFEKKQIVPKVSINQLNLQNQYVDFASLVDSIIAEKRYWSNDSLVDFSTLVFDSLIPYTNFPAGLILPYNINSITFNFSTLDGNAPSRIRYRYRLKGYEDQWSSETKNTEAKYTNLSAGSYTFEVQARIQNQVWGESSLYQFTIKPPFWKTWWFRLVVFVAVLLVIYLVFRWRNKALLERQVQLEKTVSERTQEIQQQKTLIEEKQTEILDSINYAQRIQRALLASDSLMKKHLKDYFVFFQPKDIVSGDFYWSAEVEEGNFLLVTADSTGHGVPGAIMSMLNISALDKAIESEKIYAPNEVLNFTRRKIIETLARDGSTEGGKDGMDCSIIKLETKNNTITFSGANNGIWIIRQGEIVEFNPNRMPVGKHDSDQIPFEQTVIPIFAGDIVYTFTDGFADQFGGEKGKKFKYKALKDLLLSISHLPLKEQRQHLEVSLNAWKGDLEQVDDICLIGFRV